MTMAPLELSSRWAPLRKGLGAFRAFFLGCALLGFAIVAACYIFHRQISQRLTELAVAQINRQLEETGWRLSIGRSELVNGQQLQLTQVLLYPLGSTDPAIAIDSLDLHLSSPWSEHHQPIPQPTAVVMDRSNLQINARVLREFSLDRLMSLWKERLQQHPREVDVRIRNATLRVVEPRYFPTFELRDVNLATARDEGQRTILIRCESDFFRQCLINVDQRQDTGSWSCDGHVSQFALNERLLLLLSDAGLFDAQDIHHLSGTLDWDFAVQPDATAGLRFAVRGIGDRINILHRNIPTPISHGSFRFEADNSGIAVSDVQARFGEGTFRGSLRWQGYDTAADYLVQGTVDRLAVTPQLGDVLAEAGRKFFADFAPAGVISLQFNLSRTGGQPRRWLHAQVHNGSASYHKFPYRVENLVGNLVWEDDLCRIDLQTLLASEIATLRGTVYRPGPGAIVDLDLECPGSVPIDEKLLQALKVYPAVLKQVAALKPRGQAAVSGKIQKAGPDQPYRLTYTIDLKQCFVRHDLFDYPFRNVHGKILVRDQQVTFQNITGENLDSRVTCSGTWDPQHGLALRFWGKNIVLDEQLRAAIPQIGKTAWKELRPSGRIPLVKLDLTHPAKSPDPPSIELLLDSRSQNSGSDEATYSLKPVAFPYELQDITGLVRIDNRSIELIDIHAHHDLSWMRCRGQGTFSDEGWRIELSDVLTGAIPVDQKLLHALPKGLQSAIRHIDYRGNVNVSGSLAIAGRTNHAPRLPQPRRDQDLVQVAYLAPDSPSPTSIATNSTLEWDVRIDMVRGKISLGVDISEIHGHLQLTGRYDGEQAFSRGSLGLDSLVLLNTQITDIKGPIWIDEQRVGVGMFAQQGGSESARKTPSLSGRVFDGVIELDGQTWHDRCQKFYVQTTIDNASLKQAAAVFSPAYTKIDGRGQVAVRLQGDCAAVETFQGEGVMKMYNARIHELPVLLATLKQLRRFNEDRSAFDSANIDFIVKGKHVNLSRIELLGEPISLIGNGQVDFAQNVDLNFYTIAGRNRFYLPLLSELYTVGSQQIMWINVSGTLQAPKTRQEILPGVNESLRELFR